MKLRTFFVLLVITAFAPLALGQSAANGRLVGTVSGPDGAIPGATLVITDNQTKKQRTITSDSQGLFVVSELPAGTYTVQITAQGFRGFTATDVKIDVGREYNLSPKLEVGGVQENVTVVAGADIVNSTNGELSNTVTTQQLFGLPINGRDPSSLIQLQPGVTQNGEINGQRTSANNVTRDGLNVQDNFIRSGDFNPDRPRIDDVSEFTVVTQNASAGQGSGGQAQVQYVTPRGGTSFHGAVFDYNQNSALASNFFFNNRNGVPKPFLNQNQFGGKISGPIFIPRFGEGGPAVIHKKKAFFFFEYEGLRLPQSTSITTTILTPSARQGIFTYIDDNGVQRQFNILAAQGLTINPLIASRILNGLPAVGNNTQIGDQLNTTGYTFSQNSSVNLDAGITRIDFDANQKNTFNFVYKRTVDFFNRADITLSGFGGFTQNPFVTQDSTTDLYIGAWNWTPTSKFNNEVRGGYQKSNPFFHSSNLPSDFFIGLNGFIDSPENSFLPQGRTTKYYNIQDNAVYTFGQHSVRFGGQGNYYRISSFGGASIPTYTLDNSNFPNFGFAPANTPNLDPQFIIPGLSDPNQVSTANSLQSLLAGLVGSSSNTYNVTSKTSGFVAGAPSINHLNYNNYSFYVNDQWRVTPRLTLNLGLRYELFTGLTDPTGLRIEPVIPPGTSPRDALLNPNGTFNFVGGNAGKAGQFFKTDKNNFAPVFSFAYSPQFGKRYLRGIFPGEGRTVIRGGYRWSYINDEYVRSPDNALQNAGLTQSVNDFTLTSFINAPPPIPTPTFVPPPFTFASQNALQGFNAVAFAIDPNFQLPRVEEYNFGIQREIGFKSALEIRYVGGRSHELIRVVDFNQIDIRSNGFLADFNRARANLLLTGNPACTSAGCQTLTVFPNLVNGGSLRSNTVRNMLRAGTAADLARFYVLRRLAGSVQILPNRNIGIADLLGNLGKYNYNSLQIELRRRFSQGLFLHANYTFQKTLTDIAPGNPGVTAEAQTRVAAYLDNLNPRLDYGRADYDQTHIFNFDAVYDLPFGKGKRFFNTSSRVLDRIIGGWQVGGILRINSGTPLSIVDPRGTLNRAGRSANQSAISTLTLDQIKNLIGVFRTPCGIYYINPSVIDINQTALANGQCDMLGGTGRAAKGFGSTPFSGQVFFNNGPGQTGNLDRTIINGPRFTELDMSLTKNFKFSEHVRFQIRADAFNVLNHTNFLAGVLAFSGTGTSNTTFNINSPTFGQIQDSFNFSGLNRVIQLAGRFEF